MNGDVRKKGGYRGYFAVAGVFILMAALFRFALSGYGFLALCFLAAAGLAMCYAGLRALGKKKPRPALVLRKMLTYAVILGCLAAAVTEAVIVSEVVNAGKTDRDEGYAVVLGAGVNGTRPSRALWARLNAALEFAEENPKAVLILSGGQGPNEDISEAECMFNWLVEKGIEAERLIMEDRSTSTEENLIFSREILLDLGAWEENVTVITAGYHIARARLMAEDLGYRSISARAAYTGYPILELNYYLREIPAIWWYLVSR